MSKNYLVPTNVVVSTCAHFRPYFDGGNACACGSGLRSVSGDHMHYLSYLRTRSRYYITFRVSFHLGKWWSHLLQHISKRWLPRLLTLHWIVQQHANQCALWSLRPFQLSSLWRLTCDGKSARIARLPSRMTAYRSCTVRPSQCHCAPGSAVPFAPFQSPLSSSPCAFLSGQDAQRTLLQAFRGQCIYLRTFY